MNIIILGDKFKKGMKSKGCVGLIKVNNTDNILEKQYQQFKKQNKNNNIIYVTGFESKKIHAFIHKNQEDFNISLIYNKYYDTKNHGFSIYLAKEFLNNDCLIIDGSIIIKGDMLQSMTQNGSCVMVGDSDGEVGCIINKYSVDNLSFDLDNKIYDAYYLSKRTATKLGDLIENPNYHNYFIFELINLLIDCGEEFSYLKLKKTQLCYR